MNIVAFHAHPDDETLLTGGTLARAAAEGHRVVLVTATLGEAGLARSGGALGERRYRELLAAADALGCARVETLGYADSGLDGTAADCFADAPVDEAARSLAVFLREERADVLISYDARGGYGHPDHVQVHRVGARAAQLASVPVLLEATVDRDLLRFVRRLLPLGGTVGTARRDLTHVIDVRGYLHQKRAALAAHASQTEGGLRTIRILLALPRALFARVAGREWFVQPGVAPGRRSFDDIVRAARV